MTALPTSPPAAPKRQPSAGRPPQKFDKTKAAAAERQKRYRARQKRLAAIGRKVVAAKPAAQEPELEPTAADGHPLETPPPATDARQAGAGSIPAAAPAPDPLGAEETPLGAVRATNPEAELGADPSSWESVPEAEAELGADQAAPLVDPAIEAIKARAAALPPVGLFVAAAIAGRIEQNRQACAQLGKPWPFLGETDGEKETVRAFNEVMLEQARYTVACFWPTKATKWGPVISTGVIAGGSELAFRLALKSAARDVTRPGAAEAPPAAAEPTQTPDPVSSFGGDGDGAPW